MIYTVLALAVLFGGSIAVIAVAVHRAPLREKWRSSRDEARYQALDDHPSILGLSTDGEVTG